MPNRIIAAELPASSVISPTPLEVKKGRISTSSDVCCHALFTPLHYEPNYAYPLLIWLHGPGDDERQLCRIMPSLGMRNFVAIAPRGTSECFPSGNVDSEDVDSEEKDNEHESGNRGYCWRQTDDDVFLARSRVFDCIRVAKERLNVSPRRFLLGGYGCGGTMAFRLAFENPDQFAGVVSIGGPFPRGAAPLHRLNQARRLPVLICAGQESHQYDSQSVSNDLRLLHVAGVKTQMRLYPGGDGLATNMLSDMNAWIMQQVCPSSVASD